jgi:hypothetical protein
MRNQVCPNRASYNLASDMNMSQSVGQFSSHPQNSSQPSTFFYIMKVVTFESCQDSICSSHWDAYTNIFQEDFVLVHTGATEYMRLKLKHNYSQK